MRVLQVDELQAARQVADEDDEDVGDLEGTPEDTDEEYVPAAESGSTSPSACKRRAEWRAEGAENGEAVGDDAKKDSVQCPVCDKTFKSKYYLKVHNRWAQRRQQVLRYRASRLKLAPKVPHCLYRYISFDLLLNCCVCPTGECVGLTLTSLRRKRSQSQTKCVCQQPSTSGCAHFDAAKLRDDRK